MGYQSALEAAGATVLELQEFGDYQGTWMAILDDYTIVTGSFGSCSHCDAFQSEFDSAGSVYEQNGIYYVDYEEVTKEEYDIADAEYQVRLANFGKLYLSDAIPFEDAVKMYERKVDTDYAWSDDEDILRWLKEKSSQYRVLKINSFLKGDIN